MSFRVPIAFLVAGCLLAGPASAVQTQAPKPAVKTGAKVVTVARGLNRPWALQFLPDGRFIVTERPGAIRIVDKNGKVSDPLPGAPKVAARGQGGMLDIALAPDFAKSRQVFISFTEPRRSGYGTSVARATLVSDASGDRLENLSIILRQVPASRSGLHFGSRFAFAPDGKLFVTLGERGRADFAQNLKAHYGKIVRINPDGSVPGDNPFAGRKDRPAADLVIRPSQTRITSARHRHRNPHPTIGTPATRAACGPSSTAWPEVVGERLLEAKSTTFRKPAATTAGRSSPTAATSSS